MGSVLRACVIVLTAAALVAQDAPPPEKPATPPTSRPLVAAMAEKPATMPTAVAPRVVLDIVRGGEDWGQIVIELNPEQAPLTVKNFLRYVDEGYYNGTIFHRVIPDYLIQGGGYMSATEPKLVGTHESIKNESSNGLKNTRYSVAMGRTRDPHSATSQFFINLDNNTRLDYPGRDGSGYCVFGQVVAGTEAVDRIQAVPTRPSAHARGETSEPIDPPMIKRARRVGAEPETKPPVAPQVQPAVPGGEAPAPAPAPPPPASQPESP